MARIPLQYIYLQIVMLYYYNRKRQRFSDCVQCSSRLVWLWLTNALSPMSAPHSQDYGGWGSCKNDDGFGRLN